MSNKKHDHAKHRVCPAEHAHRLESKSRKFFFNPRRLLQRHVTSGMRVLDLGCGPGFFTLELARLVGPKGKVTAADLQQKMLDKLAAKLPGTGFEKTIGLVQTDANNLKLTGKFDFILLFYMLHEVKNPVGLLKKLRGMMKTGGRVYLAEPNFRVSGKEFKRTLEQARAAGFSVVSRPVLFFSRAAVLGF